MKNLQTNLFSSVRKLISSRIGFFILALFLYWLTTVVAYQTCFTLGVKSTMQLILLFVNPLPTGLLLFSIALYFKGKWYYWLVVFIEFLEATWLFSNIIYYREFSDFLSMGIIKGSGNVQNNLGKSIGEIIHPTDLLVYLGTLILILLLVFKLVKIISKPIKFRYSLIVSIIALGLILVEYHFASQDRPGLLTRTFDNNYLVKYLGLNEFAAYSAYQSFQETKTRQNANPKDINEVKSFIDKNPTKINPVYYGKEKGKNIIIIHLESFQQFLIDYKVEGREVTPNINNFYHSDNTISFDNFYHQVSQGKTSDAEMMLENSLFGLSQGSSMVNYGSQNTYQAAPAIYDQHGYTTASFHGDVPSFWNRNNTYKSWGYQYFFDSQYFTKNPNDEVGYGLKDKIFFKELSKYLQQLPQPFYVKLITLTNHYPYEISKEDADFPATKTGDNTVDSYVQTAHYLDESFGEFMHYLHKTGLDKNSVIILYGDHYGISNNHREAISKLLNKNDINNYDLAQFQKVPLMIHANNLAGFEDHTYGGEIDVLPTLLHLSGIDTKGMILFGSDLLGEDRNQIVPFRNGDFVTPNYTKVGGTVYDTKSGEKLRLNPKQKQRVNDIQNYVNKDLSLSDKVTTEDLLRFNKLKHFKKVVKKDYNYNNSESLKRLQQANKQHPTSLEDKKHHSTESLYKTNAPEANGNSPVSHNNN